MANLCVLCNLSFHSITVKVGVGDDCMGETRLVLLSSRAKEPARKENSTWHEEKREVKTRQRVEL